MAVTGISTKLLTYFKARPNQLVTIDELIEYFAGEYNRNQIMSNARNLMATEVGSAIENPKSGVWKYTSVDSDQTVTFEILKETSNAYVLLAENGDLYRAVYIG